MSVLSQVCIRTASWSVFDSVRNRHIRCNSASLQRASFTKPRSQSTHMEKQSSNCFFTSTDELPIKTANSTKWNQMGASLNLLVRELKIIRKSIVCVCGNKQLSKRILQVDTSYYTFHWSELPKAQSLIVAPLDFQFKCIIVSCLT